MFAFKPRKEIESALRVLLIAVIVFNTFSFIPVFAESSAKSNAKSLSEYFAQGAEDGGGSNFRRR